MSAEHTDVLPIQSRVLTLKFKHVATIEGVHTIIGRKVENPALCRRCIGAPCNPDGGFCIVEAPEYVAPESCAGYVLHAGGVEGAAGRGVEGC